MKADADASAGRRQGCLARLLRERRPVNAPVLLALIVIYTMLAFTFLSLREESFDVTTIHFGAAVSAAMVLSYVLLHFRSAHIDRYLLLIVHMLFAMGMIMQYRMEPSLAYETLLWYGIGWIAFAICLRLIHYDMLLEKMRFLIIGVSVVFLGSLLLLGKESGGARNWLYIGGFSMQPSEFVKIALVLVLATLFRGKLEWRKMLQACAFCGICVGLLALERDFGAAMLLYTVFLVMFFVAFGKKLVTLLGFGMGAIGGLGAYFCAEHVRARVRIWLDPWASYYTSGYQIAQGLMAIASGGLWGLGLMQGAPKSTPAYHTDYIFAGICEEFGVIVGVALIVFYLLFILRSVCIALRAKTNYLALVAVGCTTLIAIQSFFIIGGVIKFIPLSGVTLPFVSHGGSSFVACMSIFGILEGIAMQSGRQHEAVAEENAL